MTNPTIFSTTFLPVDQIKTNSVKSSIFYSILLRAIRALYSHWQAAETITRLPQKKFSKEAGSIFWRILKVYHDSVLTEEVREWLKQGEKCLATSCSPPPSPPMDTTTGSHLKVWRQWGRELIYWSNITIPAPHPQGIKKQSSLGRRAIGKIHQHADCWELSGSREIWPVTFPTAFSAGGCGTKGHQRRKPNA